MSERHVDRAQWVTVAAAVCLCWSISVLAVRVWLRGPWGSHGPWGREDTALIVAQLFAFAQSTSAIVAARWGFGDTAPDQSSVTALKAVYVSQLLYLAAMWACKCSGSLLIMRISPPGARYRACRALLAVTTIWAVVSIILIALRGDASRPWSSTDGTYALFHRWIPIELVSMLIELALFALAISLFWRRPIRGSAQKVMLILAFGSRLFVVGPVAVRLYYLDPQYYTSAINDQHLVLASILTQIAMHYCLISASIACLKPFMQPFTVGPDERLPDSGSGTDTSRIRSRGRGSVFQYRDGTPFTKPQKNVVVSTSDISNQETDERSRPILSRWLSRKSRTHASRQSLRTLTRANGDSNFRPDGDFSIAVAPAPTAPGTSESLMPFVQDGNIHQSRDWIVECERRSPTA